ncbi:hypothetical protein N7474_002046 [Penicillium riverlandense]|uniref:uncharacterized protein n=1 Tax=Penicillium riverlandense TaxID=1903569 RepID=UPI002549504F|nr:uncharacterized protein N7474_002046 [Penicillium riverlandense]KAJ5833735.1 hypothetical protein N7474_002046 [Penicillium riverlandense]
MRVLGTLTGLLAGTRLLAPAQAIELDLSSEESIKSAASLTTWGAMSYYTGNETDGSPGIIPNKWYEGSVLFMCAMYYWHFTGDTTYNQEVRVGLESQSGNGDYLPENAAQYMGNDDQGFWGVAAMTAAELNLTDYGQYSWLSLAQGVFNTQTQRSSGWDASTCGGGVRWQQFNYMSGYTLKNAISNGLLFQLSARLYRYTNDKQYAQWAEKIWDWSNEYLIDNQTWVIADSVTTTQDCKVKGMGDNSYNDSSFLMGLAYLYNHTTGAEQAKWEQALNGLANKVLTLYFPAKYGDVEYEPSCDPFPTQCYDSNNLLFKGHTSSWLGWVSILAPQLSEQIMQRLQKTATAAAAACTGPGQDGNQCGSAWYQSKFDGRTGMEQEISASDLFSVNLIPFIHGAPQKILGPLTSTTGGSSTSNPNAGMNDNSNEVRFAPISAGDRAGAGILTAIFVAGWVGGLAWMFME